MVDTAVQPVESKSTPDYGDVLVKCISLTKIFRDFWMRPRVRAVDGIDLEVRRGEVFGLLGPNGSGKSTTIKMILGLLQPTSGRIAVFGKRPDDVATKANIGYLPEESYLYRFLNARETLEYYGRLFHQNRIKRNSRIDMLLEMVGLEAVQRRPVGEYSKGMQRRIGLAQALINDPQLLILDEPTTGLDPIGTRQIKDLILTLAERGKTIILCSHLLSDVEDVCDRVSIMFGGKVRAHGTVEELLTKQDATTINTAALDESTRQAVIELLESRGIRVDKVEQPRQRLEDLFLDIVEQAQKQGVATSGARSGGQIAQFLTEGGAPESTTSSALLEELMSASTPTAPPQPASQPAKPQPPAAPEPDTSVLSALTQPEEAKPQPPQPQQQPDQPAQPEPDRSVIDSLLDDSSDRRA